MKKRALLAGLVLTFISGAVCAQERAVWLDPVVGEGYGVQVKEGRTGSDELKMIYDAGLRYVRFVIPWYAVEKGKSGSYIWSDFDRFVDNLHRHKLRAVIVLGGGHPDYTGIMKAPDGNIDQTETYVLAPSTKEQREAFARYAAATVKHYGTKDIIWELWNEPDQDRFWAPKANVDDYIALANEACWAMRKEEPTASIIGPGMADTPGQWGTLLPGFLGAVLRSPVADCLDAVSVHPYRDYVKPPETVSGAYDNLRKFISAFTQDGKKVLPVMATEWGFTMEDVSEEEQAAFLLRSQMLNTMNHIPVSIWYEWRDAREGPEDPEAHFGLLTLDKKTKKSYRTLKEFLPPLVGAQFEKRVSVGNSEDYVLQLRHPEGPYHLVYWTSDMSSDTRFIYRCGDDEDKYEVALTAMPQRIDCGDKEPAILATHVKPNPKAEP